MAAHAHDGRDISILQSSIKTENEYTVANSNNQFQFYKVRLKHPCTAWDSGSDTISILQSSIKTRPGNAIRPTYRTISILQSSIKTNRRIEKIATRTKFQFYKVRLKPAMPRCAAMPMCNFNSTKFD